MNKREKRIIIFVVLSLSFLAGFTQAHVLSSLHIGSNLFIENTSKEVLLVKSELLNFEQIKQIEST